MRLALLVILVIFSSLLGAAQDGATERRFFKEREKIKRSGIEQITELESRQRQNEGCDSSKLRVTHKYRFDRNGNLIEASDHQGTIIKTTTYSRNEKGDYTAKDYFYFDLHANLQSHEAWKLDFNDKGQLVREQLMRDKEVVRVNVIEYNALGQRTAQTSDTTIRWTMKYDEKGNIVEFKEWRKQHDVFAAVGVTSYQYENDLLAREVTKSAADSEVWSDCSYRYDSHNRLLETVEKRTLLKRLSNGKTEMETSEFKTVNTLNKNGDLTRASIFLDSDTQPLRCKFYAYVRTR